MRSDSVSPSVTRSPATRSCAITPRKPGELKDAPTDKLDRALVGHARSSYQVKRPKNTGNPSYVGRYGVVYPDRMTRGVCMARPRLLDQTMTEGGLSCPVTMAKVDELLDPMVYGWDTTPVDDQGKLTEDYKEASPSMQGLMLVLYTMKVGIDSEILFDHPEGLRQAASLADGLLALVEHFAPEFRPELNMFVPYTSGCAAMPLHLLYCVKGLSVTASIYAKCIENGVGSRAVLKERFQRWSGLLHSLSSSLANCMGLGEKDKSVIMGSLPARAQNACFGAIPKAARSAQSLIQRGFDLGDQSMLPPELAAEIASHLHDGSAPMHDLLWPLARTNRSNHDAWSHVPG